MDKKKTDTPSGEMGTQIGNKLIAEFMGCTYSDTFMGLLPNHWIKEDGEPLTGYLDTELKYHSSWDWLIPAVEKCITYINVDDTGFKLQNNVSHWMAFLEMDKIWTSVVEFIKWYNTQNK